MSKKDSEKVRLIKKALKMFPAIVREQRRRHRAKEKILKRFQPVSEELARMVAARDVKRVKVRQHVRRVPVSVVHPDGTTQVHEHCRTIESVGMDRTFIEDFSRGAHRDDLIWPAKGRLPHKDADKYDEHIAVWAKFFGDRLHETLDVNLIKALIASESGFRPDPPGNTIALGLTQITRPTFSALTGDGGEVRDFKFSNLKFDDLREPQIAIPLAIRWLYRKRQTAQNHLHRPPTAEKLILEYKGLLKSKAHFKNLALANFRENYEKLTRPAHRP